MLPAVIKLDGIYNARDLGGYPTKYEKKKVIHCELCELFVISDSGACAEFEIAVGETKCNFQIWTHRQSDRRRLRNYHEQSANHRRFTRSERAQVRAYSVRIVF